MPRRVVVAPHDLRWGDMFATESAGVRQALGSNCVAIHHVGSTAVPAIYAKPIIDMLIEVVDLRCVDAHNPAMQRCGYEAMGEYGIAGRRFFRKDDDAGNRAYHVHLFVAGCDQVRRHLAFRDFLRVHPQWGKRYSDLKRKLAHANPDSIERYMDGKDALVHELDKLAAAWRESTGV